MSGTACFGIFWVKINLGALAVASCKNHQKKRKNGKKTSRVNTFGAQSRMRRNKTPGRIVTQFSTGVGVQDVITSANFYDCCLWGLSMVALVGGQILGFSIELGRFSKNGRSPIIRFYVSIFLISDSDPIFTVAEIALGFCSQQRVPIAAHHSVGGSARLITSPCRYTDNSASTSDVTRLMRMRWVLPHPVYGVEHVQWASACLLGWQRLWCVGGQI